MTLREMCVRAMWCVCTFIVALSNGARTSAQVILLLRAQTVFFNTAQLTPSRLPSDEDSHTLPFCQISDAPLAFCGKLLASAYYSQEPRPSRCFCCGNDADVVQLSGNMEPKIERELLLNARKEMKRAD